MTDRLLTLPHPPTANLYWRHARGRTYLSKDALAYRAAVARLTAGIQPTTSWVELILKQHRQRDLGDLDNCFKQLLDALRGRLYFDDRQVKHIDAWQLEDDKANPRVEVLFRELPTPPGKRGGAKVAKPRARRHRAATVTGATPNYVGPPGAGPSLLAWRALSRGGR